MITHTIYHISGIKVGCTHDLDSRKTWYPKDTIFEIIEELHDKTDQEAGDREWEWADLLGYKRGAHYTVSISNLTPIQRKELFRRMGSKGGVNAAAALSKEELSERARRANSFIAPEQRIKNGREGGIVSATNMTAEQRRQVSVNANLSLSATERSARASKAGRIGNASMTAQERSERSRKAGSIGGLKGAFRIKITCPNCGREGNLVNMRRYHFENCKHASGFDAPIGWEGE